MGKAECFAHFFVMKYSLPKSVAIGGEEFAIRYDFRVILEVIEMLNDADLTDSDKGEALLEMFYLNPEGITDTSEAIKQCYWFIDNGSSPNGKKSPRLMDWNQDFDYIIAPVNRVLGYETRAVDYDPVSNTGGVHWWTFLSGYMEMGADSILSQIISIRGKLAKGKKLEKHEREWLRQNRDIVTLRQNISEKDKEIMNKWIKGGDGDG